MDDSLGSPPSSASIQRPSGEPCSPRRSASCYSFTNQWGRAAWEQLLSSSPRELKPRMAPADKGRSGEELWNLLQGSLLWKLGFLRRLRRAECPSGEVEAPSVWPGHGPERAADLMWLSLCLPQLRQARSVSVGASQWAGLADGEGLNTRSGHRVSPQRCSECLRVKPCKQSVHFYTHPESDKSDHLFVCWKSEQCGCQGPVRVQTVTLGCIYDPDRTVDGWMDISVLSGAKSAMHLPDSEHLSKMLGWGFSSSSAYRWNYPRKISKKSILQFSTHTYYCKVVDTYSVCIGKCKLCQILKPFSPIKDIS